MKVYKSKKNGLNNALFMLDKDIGYIDLIVTNSLYSIQFIFETKKIIWRIDI